MVPPEWPQKPVVNSWNGTDRPPASLNARPVGNAAAAVGLRPTRGVGPEMIVDSDVVAPAPTTNCGVSCKVTVGPDPCAPASVGAFPLAGALVTVERAASS